MASEGDRGGTNPGPGTHPRMSAPLPEGPGGAREKLSEAAGQVRDKVRDVASQAAERLGETWESTRQGAQAVVRKAQDFWSDAGNLVRRNPMAALAITFGVGCLVGCALTAGWDRWEDDVVRGMSRGSA